MKNQEIIIYKIQKEAPIQAKKNCFNNNGDSIKIINDKKITKKLYKKFINVVERGKEIIISGYESNETKNIRENLSNLMMQRKELIKNNEDTSDVDILIDFQKSYLDILQKRSNESLSFTEDLIPLFVLLLKNFADGSTAIMIKNLEELIEEIVLMIAKRNSEKYLIIQSSNLKN